MRVDRSKGMLRQVRITVKNEGALGDNFQSYRGGKLGLAFRTPDAIPLTPADNGSRACRTSHTKSEREDKGVLPVIHNHQRRLI